jgi:hypothetical protein
MPFASPANGSTGSFGRSNTTCTQQSFWLMRLPMGGLVALPCVAPTHSMPPVAPPFAPQAALVCVSRTPSVR